MKRSSGRRKAMTPRRSAHENPTGAQTALIVVGVLAGVAVVGGVAYAATRKKEAPKASATEPLVLPDSIQPNHTYKLTVTAPPDVPVAKKYTRPELQAQIDLAMPGVARILSGPDYNSNASGITAEVIVKYLGANTITHDPQIDAAITTLRGQLRDQKMTLTVTDQGDKGVG